MAKDNFEGGFFAAHHSFPWFARAESPSCGWSCNRSRSEMGHGLTRRFVEQSDELNREPYELHAVEERTDSRSDD